MSRVKAIARPFEKLLDIIQRITVSLGALLAFAMGLLMLYMVIARYFFDYNFEWGQVILTGMLVWGALLIFGSVARRRQHVAIGFFAKVIFKKRAPLVQHTAENIVCLPFCIFMAWHSWSWVDESRDLGLIKFVGTDTYDAWIPTVVMAIGFAIGSLFYLERCVKQLYGLYLWSRKDQLDHTSPVENHIEGRSG